MGRLEKYGFVGEIIRGDEIGLIVWRGQPILMVQVNKIDFETKEHYIEMINFKDSELKEMLVEMKLNSTQPRIACSGFEIFCYRPKHNKPYHPKMHLTYNQARENDSRVMNVIFMVVVKSGKIDLVSFAQVGEKTSINFFKELSK